jgi:Ca-activated chloride channel family protein
VTVRGNMAGRPFEQRIAVELPTQSQASSAIASVWARERIGELEREMRDGETRDLVDALTDVALSHRLVSRFTSFVAVEERVAPARDAHGPTRTVAVPVELPEGVSPAHVFDSSLSLARFQPGDPELRVHAPYDARAVVAVFPFGETRTLAWEPRLSLWTTRFLVPRGTPEGNYHIQIVVTLADGTQERTSEGYTVDGSAPDVEVTFEAEPMAGADVEVIARQRFTAADRALHGRRRTEILSDVARLRLTTEDGSAIRMELVRPGVWRGTWHVPEDAPAEAELRLVAFDVAGNRSARVVRVEIEDAE